MSYSTEVVAIHLLEQESTGAWRWRALYGQPHTGCDMLPLVGLQPGDELIARVVRRKAGVAVREIVSKPGHVRPSAHPVLRAAPRTARPAGPQPGDVVVARVRFTKDDGSARGSKRRPCVVIRTIGDELVLRPVFGTNTAMRRTGQARRIRNWKAAGLLKPSVVGGDELLMPTRAITGRIGALAEPDRRLLAG